MRSTATLLVLLTLSVLAPKVFAASNAEYEAGAAFFQKEDYYSALHSFQQAYQYSPSDPNVLYGMASCLSKMKRYPEARSFYTKTLASTTPRSKLSEYASNGLKYLDSVESTQASQATKQASAPFSMGISHGNPNPFQSAQMPGGFSSGTSGSQSNQPGFYQPNGYYHHGYGNGSNNNVGPYTMANSQPSYNYSPYFHVPSIQIKEYSYPSSPKPPELSVELLAKQEKLVTDAKPAH